ncbi:hypothetical protein MRX96_058938 [Rhipicephalus microplus]
MAQNPAVVWEYTLTGFSDFLDQRHAFTEPIPSSRVWGICGRLPSITVVLPCGDVFCELCLDEVCGETKCTFDGRVFSERQLVRLRFELSKLEQRRVVCIQAGRQCAAFNGQLSELREQMRRCRSMDVKCAKCNRAVAHDVALDHYKQCIDGNAWRVSVYDLPVQRAVEEIRVMKKDLESLREQALGELDDDDDDDLVNTANVLIERVAGLDHSLSLAQEKASAFHRESASLDSSKSPAPGPYRFASKLGVFITTCEFRDVYAAHNLLTQAKKEHKVVSEPHILSGYTFRLDAHFLLSGEGNDGVSMSFSMYLKSGNWDDYVEWPFSKKVTVIIAHPRDVTKDVRLPLRVDGSNVVIRRAWFPYNSGHKTGKKSWEDIELGGYIIKNTLYVHVEFE